MKNLVGNYVVHVLDSSRPLKNGQNRVDDFKKLINDEISYI